MDGGLFEGKCVGKQSTQVKLELNDRECEQFRILHTEQLTVSDL
jgi:hypothetical protein